MEAELDKMLCENVIEECESPWLHQLYWYQRKTVLFDFALITDGLMPLQEQVGVKSEDQDKTAFVTPFGTFRFKRMPFGLRNAPATFQRLIDSFEQHLIDLRAVFDRLREFNLHANRPKCVFAKETVKYLGHIITPQGIAPDPDKINAIVHMKEPTTVKHLKSVLQTCSWFRKFVPNFSQVAQPLTMLTKKNQSWKWEEAQRTAFHELKRSLTSPPILIQPNYDFPFVLRTDASDYALGAALLQGRLPMTSVHCLR
ncbi:Retrovirus-related Pol polyprotein from transposon 17.6 [Eumeta japonica]|uniref:RNA-directed DNA polymerase n=1 Tax=Eumeta variegata TaxID=151549 RepID=A0A4C1U1F6_EUMVA|nr:Retrovirus-related Pol polyprotein from transposon 17.6 [Eumeta japonica]